MKWVKTFGILITLLGSIFMTSACTNQTNGVIQYLTTVGPAFEQSKDDIKMFDEEMVMEDSKGIADVLQALGKSKTNYTTRLEEAKKQTLPENPPQLSNFHQSLVQYYGETILLMSEYEDILRYEEAVFLAMEPVEKTLGDDLGKAPSMEEVKSKTKTIKASIDEASAALEKSSPPHYMADSHRYLIDVMKNISTSTDDFIYAMQLSDPLRINAATYRYDLLSIKLEKVSQELNKDIEERQVKLNELGKKMQNIQDELYKQLLLWKGEYKIGA